MRTLTAIELNDFGRFADLKIKLSGRLVGLVGPNGAGKSTVMRAIKFAVTGELPRVGRKGPVRIGRKSDSQPYVKLDLVSSTNEPAVVIRWVPDGKRDGRRRLVCGDFNETTTDGVAAWFESDTGVSVKTASEILFVPQGRLCDVVTDPPARRAEMLQRLFGLDAAEAARRAAIDHLVTIPSPPPEEVLLAARNRHTELSVQFDDVRTQLFALPQTDPALPGARALLAAAEYATALLPVRERTKRKYDSLCALLTLPPIEPSDDEELLAAADASRVVASYELTKVTRDRANTAVARATVYLGELDRSPPPVPGPEPVPSPELVAARGTKQILAAVAVCRVGDTCPVCGSGAGLGGDMVARAKAALAVYEESEAAHTASVALHRTATACRDKWIGLRDRAVEGLEAADRNRTSVIADVEPPTPVQIARASAHTSLLSRSRAVDQDRAERRRAAEELNTVTAELNAIDAEIEAAAPPGLVAVARTVVDANIATEDRRRSLTARLEVTAESHRQSKASVDRVEAIYTTADATKDWRTIVTDAAALVHRDAAPARAAADFLAELTIDINERLEQLAATFHVSVDVDGNIVAKFGSHEIPVEMLSGGEQAVLSLAWRMATPDRFAPTANVLCLDEPTYGLDEERMEALRDALQRWRSETDDRQLIIVTHDRRLAGVFDTLVEL